MSVAVTGTEDCLAESGDGEGVEQDDGIYDNEVRSIPLWPSLTMRQRIRRVERGRALRRVGVDCKRHPLMIWNINC